MHLLSPSGEGLGVAVGPAVSRLICKVSGLRRYRPGRFIGEAAMTNAGPLAGMWHCVSPHVFAIVIARSGSLLSALRAHGAVDADPKDRENDVAAEACPRPWVEKKADAATGGMFVG